MYIPPSHLLLHIPSALSVSFLYPSVLSYDVGTWTSTITLDVFDFDQPNILQGPILVIARSKVWVCGRSLAGIAGSNPAGSGDVFLV